MATFTETKVGEQAAQYITAAFKARRHLLESVHLQPDTASHLLYNIVLADDTDEHRSSIFEILDDAQNQWLTDDYPVYFQFYPQHLKGSIQPEGLVDLR